MAIFLYGELQRQNKLYETVVNLQTELQSYGYKFGNPAQNLRIYPFSKNNNSTINNHFNGIGGTWSPYKIFVQPNPIKPYTVELFLKHELMHEANFHTCKGKLPIWADEASALAFSGEVKLNNSDEFKENELTDLKTDIKLDTSLKTTSRKALAVLIKRYGWNIKAPCTIPENITSFLNSRKQQESGEIAWRIIHLVSGKVIRYSGSQTKLAPLGSLLKIPVYASIDSSKLSKETLIKLSDALLASDSNKMLYLNKIYNYFNKERFFSIINSNSYSLNEEDLQYLKSSNSLEKWMLGERKSNENWFHSLNLIQAAWLMRNSILSGDKELFKKLENNGIHKNSTLFKNSEKLKKLLQHYKVLAKTGSTGNKNGKPYYGHVLYLWPKANPQYLAIFRQEGVNGFVVAEHSLQHLADFISSFKGYEEDVSPGIVKVELYSKLKDKKVKISADCPTFASNWYESSQNGSVKFSTCGTFTISLLGQKNIKEKIILGGLQEIGNQFYLLTDPISYTNAVVQAEDSKIKGEAQKAFRSIIYWNALFSHKTNPICDTTKCMVFLGNSATDLKNVNRLNDSEQIDPNLISYLNALKLKEKWLMFAKGGVAPWRISISSAKLNSMLQTSLILSIQRYIVEEHKIKIHVQYSDSEEYLDCELFRNKLKLYSCPDSISFDRIKKEWFFSGFGEGHGTGFNVEYNKLMAVKGKSAIELLKETKWN